MPNENALLQIEHLKKSYFLKKGVMADKTRAVHAVDDVSLTIPRFLAIGLVGESGCGKSTLGKTILRLTDPSGGRVTFRDTVLFDVEQNVELPAKEMRALRKEMAMIFQDPYSSLNPHMSIGEAVREGVHQHGIVPKGEEENYCREILQSCGLEGNAYFRYPNEFSGGQRQRAVIARALALQPKFVVCDEATAALDVSIQSQILNLMLDLREKWQLTYLFISHNLEVTRAFCDEIAVMYLGKIVEQGPAEEVFSRSLHPYTRALIASLPISEPGEQRRDRQLLSSIPSMMNIPTGCRFHPRCPYATERCRSEEPEMKECGCGHFAACHLL